MAQFIYYRDEDKEKGPLTEAEILKLYNGAEFTSDVTFQIRSSQSDKAAPFVQLRDLISKNGHTNPFRDMSLDLDKRIADAEKELEKLKEITRQKAEMEEKIADMEKDLADFKGLNQGLEDADLEALKVSFAMIDLRLLEDKKKRGDNADPTPRKMMPPTDYHNEKLSLDNEIHRKALHDFAWKHPLCWCTTCPLTFSTFKQTLMHVDQTPACRECMPSNLTTKFAADFDRWKEEDAARLSMGQRLFSKLTTDEKIFARPQTDYIEAMNDRLKKVMDVSTIAAKDKSMEFLKTDEAKQIRDRLEKHFREAKGKLVCKECEVVCKNNIHFLIHIATYGHRLKVKGTSFELISLLLGWFSRDLYLNRADPSEMSEFVEPDMDIIRGMDYMRMSGLNLTGAVIF